MAFTKPLLDRLFAVLLLILLSPLLLLISILQLFLSDGIFFRQQRSGRKGKLFTLYKFKSMRDISEEKLFAEAERLTSWGKWLRGTSIDELPQLYNVLRGDMSFIGPRPLLPEYTTQYNDHQRKRLDVKPGISGIAQIKECDDSTWQSRFNNDIQYVENLSFALDLKLFFATIRVLAYCFLNPSKKKQNFERFQSTIL